jgi:8-amino-7-oxononanoate synthase
MLLYDFEQKVNSLRQKHLYRKLEVLQGVDFCSNDYLGFSKNNILNESIRDYLNNNGEVFASSSRLISGTRNLHIEAEVEIAEFLGREASLIFNSGYCANVGVISTLCRNSIIYSDELNHASIIDGAKKSKADVKVYRHNDYLHLEKLLANDSAIESERYIITESIFSMDGTLSDIRKLLSLSVKYNTFLIVDEAHSTGILGYEGRGLIYEEDINENRVVSIHTCGKALGCYGAFIGCSEDVREYLINCCREFIFTTALPPLNILLILQSIKNIRVSNDLRIKLRGNIEYFRSKLSISSSSKTQIQPFFIEGNKSVVELSRKIRNAGIDIVAIRYPTIAKGLERVRISIHSTHTFEEINALAVYLNEYSEAQI